MAFVTGGSGLLGRETAKGLADFGATVYIVDISDKNVKNLICNSNIKYIECDITSKESIDETISKVVTSSGRLDILVNTAYPRTKDWGLKFEEVPFDSWQKNVNDHLGGYFLVCQAAARQMKRQGGGSIINFASIYGVVAPDFSLYEGTVMTMPAAYSAIKGGIISLTRYIATLYAPYNIRANTVSPGGIQDKQPRSFVEKYSSKTPLGRMGTPQEFVGTVIYLASDASSYVTGQNIIVDGGWTAW